MESVAFETCEAKFLAEYIIALVKANVAYKVEKYGDTFFVTVTGF
jgi:hypothetical protein